MVIYMLLVIVVHVAQIYSVWLYSLFPWRPPQIIPALPLIPLFLTHGSRLLPRTSEEVAMRRKKAL